MGYVAQRQQAAKARTTVSRGALLSLTRDPTSIETVTDPDAHIDAGSEEFCIDDNKSTIFRFCGDLAPTEHSALARRIVALLLWDPFLNPLRSEVPNRRPADAGNPRATIPPQPPPLTFTSTLDLGSCAATATIFATSRPTHLATRVGCLTRRPTGQIHGRREDDESVLAPEHQFTA